MTKIDFTGLAIPPVTPFLNDKKQGVDLKKLEKLIDFLIVKQKADIIIPVGTTGESTSLSHEEKELVIRHTIEVVDGRVPVFAGTGGPNTEDTIAMTRFAQKAGADGVLVVSPCYIRPNQEGLIRHFTAVAKSTDLPIILYNIPSRTGVPLLVDTVVKIANAAKNVIAIKDCPGSTGASMDIVRKARSEIKHPFAVLTGEDDNSFMNLCFGGDGIIAATGHVIGAELKEMTKAFRKGNLAKAREIQYSILDLQRLLFSVPNPAMIKAALDMIGPSLGGRVRSPLSDAPKEQIAKLKVLLKKMGKI